MFSAKMTYIVLNPYWYVPKTIAEKDFGPSSERNPSYFGRNNFAVRRIPAGYKQVPDPDATDGSMKSVRVYDYVLRQGPGPKNALGRVKFMFPNPYSVYLHDTPSKSLFNRTVRAFSHGCIRIEKPVELAEYLFARFSKVVKGRDRGDDTPLEGTNCVFIRTPAYLHSVLDSFGRR